MKENNSLQALLNPGEAEDFFEVAGLAEFEPSVTMRYSRTNALWLAEFSRLIYRQESDEIKTRPAGFRTRDEFLRARGWRQEAGDFFNVGANQAGLFVNAKLQCGALVFRPRQPTFQHHARRPLKEHLWKFQNNHRPFG